MKRTTLILFLPDHITIIHLINKFFIQMKEGKEKKRNCLKKNKQKSDDSIRRL